MKLTWTKTDEAPALASYALLPILRAYFKGTGAEIETADISLAGRIAANFPEHLKENQQIPDELTRLGELAKTPEANIVKLPNISASIPQLRDAIVELQGKGYNIPDYPDSPSTEAERALQARFAVVLGSAVNPVLREGNSDRRAPASVKAFARKHPGKMKPWPKRGSETSGSVTRVAHMSDKDFFCQRKIGDREFSHRSPYRIRGFRRRGESPEAGNSADRGRSCRLRRHERGGAAEILCGADRRR